MPDERSSWRLCRGEFVNNVGMPGPNWAELERIAEVLHKAMSELGMQGIEFVTGLSEPYDSSVWLCTATEADQDKLLDNAELLELVRVAIKRAGLDTSLTTQATSQSQETAHCVHAGNWLSALS